MSGRPISEDEGARVQTSGKALDRRRRDGGKQALERSVLILVNV